jgi:hypothetical protein
MLGYQAASWCRPHPAADDAWGYVVPQPALRAIAFAVCLRGTRVMTRQDRRQLLAAFESDRELAAWVRELPEDHLRDVLTVLFQDLNRDALVELVRRLAWTSVR